MSWSFKLIGKRANVKAAVNKLDYVPASVKAVVADFCDAGSKDPSVADSLVQVESGGHYNASGCSNIYKLEFNLVTVAPDVEPAPEAAPAAAPEAAAATAGEPAATA